MAEASCVSDATAKYENEVTDEKANEKAHLWLHQMLQRSLHMSVRMLVNFCKLCEPVIAMLLNLHLVVDVSCQHEPSDINNHAMLTAMLLVAGFSDDRLEHISSTSA